MCIVLVNPVCKVGRPTFNVALIQLIPLMLSVVSV